MDDLLAAKEELKKELVQFPGVFDVKDNFNIGKEEISKLLPLPKTMGEHHDARESSPTSILWFEVQSIQRGRDEVKSDIGYPKDERRSISNLENMMIRTPNGSTIPVRQIAKLEIGGLIFNTA